MKKFALLLLGIIMLTTLVGCETFKGMGKDLENTGSNIQKVLN